MQISIHLVLYVLGLTVLLISGFAHPSKVFHKCDHDDIDPQLSILHLPGEEHKSLDDISIEKEKHRRSLGITTFQPIRITFDVEGLVGLNRTQYDFIVNQILPAVQQFFQSFLTVAPLSSPIIMQGDLCHKAWVPNKYQSTGASNTDILIFVTYDPVQSDAIAWAASCKLNSKNYRPLAGQINFNTDNLDTTIYHFKKVLQTMIHEMTHILVFSKNLYRYYVNPDGSLKQGFIKNATIRGVDTTVNTLPSVVKWAQEYFNCSEYTGVELENQGKYSSRGSHWERRVFANELMTSSMADDAVYTNLTLNLFEESGWYLVDRSKADALFIGKGLGCTFLNSSCVKDKIIKTNLGFKTIKTTEFPDVFCTEATESSECSATYTHKSFCAITSQYDGIPSAFNYWNDGWTGSTDQFSDNCPYMDGYSNGDCRNPDNRKHEYYNYFDEKYGPTSRCFTGNFIKIQMTKKGYKEFNHSACLASKCQNGTLTIYVGPQEHICPVEGGRVYLDSYAGWVNCPPTKDFCYRAWVNQCENSCGGIGLCFGGSCLCPANVSESKCNSSGYSKAPSANVTFTDPPPEDIFEYIALMSLGSKLSGISASLFLIIVLQFTI